MVVDGNSELLFRLLLTNDVLVKKLLNFMRYRKSRSNTRAVLETAIVGDDVVTHLDTLITDEYGWTSDELPHIILVFVAERATENLRITLFLAHA